MLEFILEIVYIAVSTVLSRPVVTCGQACRQFVFLIMTNCLLSVLFMDSKLNYEDTKFQAKAKFPWMKSLQLLITRSLSLCACIAYLHSCKPRFFMLFEAMELVFIVLQLNKGIFLGFAAVIIANGCSKYWKQMSSQEDDIVI
jgi:hypothetical protein